MEDREIIRLYRDRDQRALAATAERYGAYCAAVARNILGDEQDVEECVSDVWLAAWNSIPSQTPVRLGAYLAGLTRNAALRRWRDGRRLKRGGGETALAYEELADCLPGGDEPSERLEARELAEFIRRFLAGLEAEERQAFLCRYWYFDSVEEIARRFGCSRSRVSSMLFRTRKRLRRELEKEGYFIDN